MRSFISAPGVAVLVLATLVLGACDSSGDDVRPVDVAGEYLFTEFVFVPASPLLPAANVLDTLVVSETRLQLFSSSRFTLLFQFNGAQQEFVGGDFRVNERRVRLIGHEDEAGFYRRLLLGTEITLMREADGGFSAEIPRTVNLEEYSDLYAGLTSVEGVVSLVLVRR